MTATAWSTLAWGRVDLDQCPAMTTPAPGPKSREFHQRCIKRFKGLSSQVKLFPVAFESGEGCVLVDVDGNRYIDFSSGIYVTTLGHCHPKISEAMARHAGQLMNAHDFTTPIKTELVEKLAEILPGDFGGFQFYDAGTAAVEAGMRVLRAATGTNEMLSCFNDFHGKTYGAVSLAQIRSPVYGRVRMPGAHMVPRPDPYRPLWTKPDGTIDTDQYLAFYDEYIEKATVGDVAGFVLEPIQGWAGSVMPPDDFFPKLRKFCDERRLLLMADEVLDQLGPHGQMAVHGALGRRARRGRDRQGLWQRVSRSPAWPCGSRTAESFEKISASSSYGGNPMACAAALASTEVIEEENLLEHALHLGELAQRRMERMKAEHPIVGDVRAQGLPDGDRVGQGPADQGALRQGGRTGLPEGLPQGPGLDPRRPHPPHEPADRHGRRRLAQGTGPDRRGHRGDGKGTGVFAIMKRIRFGIIGCGLMGREFASAAARWCHLPEMDVRPGDRRRLRRQAGPAFLVQRAFSLDPPGHAKTIGPCWTIPRSRPSTAPSRTICTRRFTARSWRRAST